SQQQAAGVDQVNTAITKMDETTQQNAALVEESAAASKSMQHQAQELARQLAFFRTNSAAVTAPPAAIESARKAPLKVVRPVTKKSPSTHAAPAPLKKASGGDDNAWTEF